MRPVDTDTLAAWRREELLRRNGIFKIFFKVETRHEMSRRFLAGEPAAGFQ